jgi:glucosamine 6-phosphate synthetase-like amidotransferase/phosphosugar isomerase protein
MCGLFGFLNYGLKINTLQINELIDALAMESAARGTDAVGIAYTIDSKIEIEKEPKSAYEVTFRLPKNLRAVIGHTRHSTQGSSKKKYNNHPFRGRLTDSGMFALAHNGIIANDHELRKKHGLPETKIETDSYIAVQLLERDKELSMTSIRSMVEKLRGSFTFSVLDDQNNIYLIRGDNPLSMLHFTSLGLYVYASTDQILWRAFSTSLLSELKSGRIEEVRIEEGQILGISPDGTLTWGEFECLSASMSDLYDWWDIGWSGRPKHTTHAKAEYIAELKSVACACGHTPDDIDYMLHCGYELDEIEELLYGEEAPALLAEER